MSPPLSMCWSVQNMMVVLSSGASKEMKLPRLSFDDFRWITALHAVTISFYE